MADREQYQSIVRQAEERMFSGKGRERHGRGLPMDQQPIRLIPLMVGPGGLSYQMIKKTVEAQYLPAHQAIPELLDVINYAVEMVIHRQNNSLCGNKSVCSCAAHRPGEGGE